MDFQRTRINQAVAAAIATMTAGYAIAEESRVIEETSEDLKETSE